MNWRPFTLPATLPATRIFSHYPTRTLPEVKKPYPSQPGWDRSSSYKTSSILCHIQPALLLIEMIFFTATALTATSGPVRLPACHFSWAPSQTLSGKTSFLEVGYCHEKKTLSNILTLIIRGWCNQLLPLWITGHIYIYNTYIHLTDIAKQEHKWYIFKANLIFIIFLPKQRPANCGNAHWAVVWDCFW